MDFLPCTFPFRYNKKWYDGCTADIGYGGAPSCAIDANIKGNYRSIARCSKDCPGGKLYTEHL